MSKSAVPTGGVVCFRNPKDCVTRGRAGANYEKRQPEDKPYKLFIKPG